MVLLAIALWWLPQSEDIVAKVSGLFVCALITYLQIETNNRYQLIRVRSRAVSSTWLILIGSMGMYHTYSPGLSAALCVAISIYLLFHAYQESQPVVDSFHVFVFLGIGAIFVPQLLFFIPFYWWYFLVFMRAISFRSFWASILGFALPFWMWIMGCFFLDRLSMVMAWWSELSDMLMLHWNNYLATPLLLVSALFVAILAVWCGIAYLRHSYNDKIRTRMFNYVYIFHAMLLLMCMVVQPQWIDTLLPIFLVTVSPIIAHYFTLTRTWLSLIVFLVTVVGLVFISLLTLGDSESMLIKEIITRIEL